MPLPLYSGTRLSLGDFELVIVRDVLTRMTTMRRFFSSACFVLGTVWSAAGTLKLLFGVRVTLPLLPPLGLEQVSVAPSIAIGLAFFATAAILARVPRRTEAADLLDSTLEPHRLVDGAGVPVVSAARASVRQPDKR